MTSGPAWQVPCAIAPLGGCEDSDMPTENRELLHRYVADLSESACASLVERHIDLVYSAELRREQLARAMIQLLESPGPDPDWQELRPVLDDAMHDLNATDRDAVLMRYFEERPLAETGARLGLTENAARMRG